MEAYGIILFDMHTIIFEGIATSGKSTLIGLLTEHFRKTCKTSVFTEEQTHEPIMKDMASANVPFFESLLAKIDKDNDVVIFDRLYLTQAFRAGADLGAYARIEKELQLYSPLTVYLKVDEATVAERVVKAAEHRRASWGDYIKTKGKTPDEIADYYIMQQRSQLLLLKESTLPYEIFDTTNHQYNKIAEKIISTIAG
jgi:thymidylate kinase